MSEPRAPTLIVFGGLPGTGKTTIARELTKRLSATYLRIDAIEQSLRAAGADVGAMGYVIANAVAAENLRLGRCVIADCVNPVAASRRGWRETARRNAAGIIEIETFCSDVSVHRRRLEGRVPDIDGLKLPTWSKVATMAYEPWDRDHFILDTANGPIAYLADLAEAHIRTELLQAGQGLEIGRSEIGIAPEDPRQPEVRRLIAESDTYMQALYPAESNHLVDADALAASDTTFFVARRDGEVVGSIALRIIAPGHAEMKRMFVRPDARGSGLGRRLLEALEQAAQRQHVARISLETGIRQPEAISLYRASGYQECPPFGTYSEDPLSLFMTKRLAS